MIKKIMKMGGCKTEAEFYKKYPTEQAFMEAFPQARPMMEQFRSGGSTSAAFPQAPTADKFFNYGPATMNVPRLMQTGGENQDTNQQAFMQIVSAVAQNNNVQPDEILSSMQDNIPEEDLEKLTMSSSSDPEAVLQMVNAYTQNYLAEDGQSAYQYLEGQPYMQQMLDQQVAPEETQEAPEESYQMPVDPNQAMQMAYGGGKLNKFTRSYQTGGPKYNSFIPFQPGGTKKPAPAQEEDSFWDTGLGMFTRMGAAGVGSGLMAYGMARAANSEWARKALGVAEDVWASMKAGEKLKAIGKELAKMAKKPLPKTKSSKAGWLTGVASAALYGAGEYWNWWGDSPQATGTTQPQVAPKTAVLNTQSSGIPADSSDAMRAPELQPDTASKIKNTVPGGNKPKTKGATKDSVAFNFKQGGQKKKFQPGGLWNKFSNYISDATPGDAMRDLAYNLDRGGPPSEWVTAPRMWVGSYEDEAGNIVKYNEYSSDPAERAAAEEMKAKHADLVTRAQYQSDLADIDPYEYSARPEWLGGSPNWRRNLAYSVSGLGEKFKTDYDSPHGMFDQPGKMVSFEKYTPADWLSLGTGLFSNLYNPAQRIGAGMMMANMGPDALQRVVQSPYEAQRNNSYYPYIGGIGNLYTMGKSGLLADLGIMASDIGYYGLVDDNPEDYSAFDYSDVVEAPNQTISVQNAPGFQAKPQTTPAARSRVNINPFGTAPIRRGDPFSRNPKDRRPQLKKGGQSAPMGKSSNEDIISARLDKLKGYINENVTSSMLKDEQDEIINAFMQPPPMPEQQTMEGDYMQTGGGSSGFIDFINPFDRRRAEATILQGQPQADYSFASKAILENNKSKQINPDPNMKPGKPEGWSEPMDPDYNPNAPKCPPGYKYDAQKGDCVVAQTRAGKALDAVGDAWKNASGQELASGALTGLSAISGAMERNNMRKREKQLEQNIWERQMTSNGPTDKGKYITNSGDFVPPTMQTPVQFTGYNPGVFAKKGAQVDGEVTYLTDDQIKHIISLGGQVEFLD